MIDLNCCQFMGNLVQDAQCRKTDTGTPVVYFTIACNFRQRDYEEVHFQPCNLFGQIAPHFSDLSKGDVVWVMGRMRTNKWEDRNGDYREEKCLLINQIRRLNPEKDKGDVC